MEAVNRTDVYNISNKMNLKIVHFARGTYIKANGKYSKLSCNRFFVPIMDGGEIKSYIRDMKNNFDLAVGNIYFIPCYHTGAVFLTENLQFISIQFNLELYRGIDVFFRLGEIKCFYEPEFVERVKQSFEYKNDYIAAAALRCVVWEMTVKLLSAMSAVQIEALNNFAEFSDIIQYISKNCTAATSIKELAVMHGSSREHFTRRFSKIIGISPKQYLNNALLNRAIQMILKDDLLSKEIASELEFSNEFYFSRFFKKNMGFSPRVFKRIHFPV